jgi:hypothetical protein
MIIGVKNVKQICLVDMLSDDESVCNSTANKCFAAHAHVFFQEQPSCVSKLCQQNLLKSHG